MKLAKVAIGLSVLFVSVQVVNAQNDTWKLPEPKKSDGMPLMEALKKRHSARSFSSEALSEQVLSNLLWAAFGINRPESGKRTAPSAKNQQEIDIYVTLEKGLYLYNAKDHNLELLKEKDRREFAGGQDFVATAPVNLIYVADYSDMGGNKKTKRSYAYADTGFIGQNVYLYCASEGLNCVIRGWIDKKTLRKKLDLNEDQKIILAQTVGHPE